MDQGNHRVNMATRLLVEYMLQHRAQLTQLAQLGMSQDEQVAAYTLLPHAHQDSGDVTPLPSPVGTEQIGSPEG